VEVGVLGDGPKVSVIVPVYNSESYLRECLDSALAQTMGDFELICVDDGSTDTSGAILAEYAALDPRMKIITQQNGGAAKARNVGMDLALGKYVQFLDSDDTLVETALEEGTRIMDEEQLELLFFEADVRYETRELELDQPEFAGYYRYPPGKFEQAVGGRALFASLVKADSFRVAPQMQMIATRLLNDNGIRFPVGIIQEDELFSFLVCFQAKRARCLSKALCQRRVRPGSVMTSSTATRRAEGYFVCMHEMLDFVTGKELSEADQESVRHRLETLRRLAVRWLDEVPEDQRSAVLSGAGFRMRTEFDLMIVTGVDELVLRRRKGAQVEALAEQVRRLQAQVSDGRWRLAEAEERLAAAEAANGSG
jgi:hypothetical protein